MESCCQAATATWMAALSTSLPSVPDLVRTINVLPKTRSASAVQSGPLLRADASLDLEISMSLCALISVWAWKKCSANQPELGFLMSIEFSHARVSSGAKQATAGAASEGRHVAVASGRTAGATSNIPLKSSLAVSDWERQRSSVAVTVRSSKTIFVQASPSEPGLTLSEEEREGIRRGDEQMQQQPGSVAVLVDLPRQFLCRIEGVLTTNNGSRGGTGGRARDQQGTRLRR